MRPSISSMHTRLRALVFFFTKFPFLANNNIPDWDLRIDWTEPELETRWKDSVQRLCYSLPTSLHTTNMRGINQLFKCNIYKYYSASFWERREVDWEIICLEWEKAVIIITIVLFNKQSNLWIWKTNLSLLITTKQ